MTAPDDDRGGSARPGASARVHPGLERAAGYAWRIIVVGVVVLAALWLAWRLRLIVLPFLAALLLSVALNAPARWLRARRWPPALAAWAAMVGFLAVLGLVGWVVVPEIIDEFSDLGPTIEEGVDDLEDWLVQDSPIDVSRNDIQNFREEVKNWAADAARSQMDRIVSGALVVFEVLAGSVLALVIAFFLVKDGERIQRWFLGHLPEGRREVARRLGRRSWSTLAGYLMGSAALGTVEAVAIGTTVALVGGTLVVPVMVLTFIAAFLPFVGAILAGFVAVLVTLVAGGLTDALIVAAVALVVQQFDNDLLAPLVFGRALQLHPVVILFAITGGVALIGVAGAFVAVPLTAVTINAISEYRSWASDGRPEEPGDHTDDTASA